MPEQALHTDTFDKQIPSRAGTKRRRRFVLLLLLAMVLIGWWWLNAQNADRSDGVRSHTQTEKMESGRTGIRAPHIFSIDL